MAFDIGNLNLILGSIGGGATALYDYPTVDTLAAVLVRDYFAAISQHRLRVDDLVLVVASDRTAIVQIISVSASGNATVAVLEDNAGEENLSTKSPVIDWAGRTALALGTSIPHQGGDIDSYHHLMGKALGNTVVNMAWSGTSAGYDVGGDGFTATTVRRLSMTEDDRLAGLALYGAASAYADSFSTTHVASQMTADYRIKAPFAANPFSVVFLDHNHNDRGDPAGTLTPPSLAITNIVKGATTTIYVASAGTFEVGNAIAIRVVGIAKMDYFAGRVQAVAGNILTVNVNSSGFAGSFTSGTAYKLDRGTIWGSFEFLIYYIKWCALLYDRGPVEIILSGAPSAYTNNAFDPKIRSSSEILRLLADKWSLAYFDIERAMNIDARSQLIYFSDGIHPLEREARQAVANFWTEWGSGGAVKRPGDYEFLRAGALTFTEDREAFYTKFKDGFTTPTLIQGVAANVVSDNFAAGLGGWTLSGTGVAPTTVVAPWNAAQTAVYCLSNGTDSSYLAKTGLVLDKGGALQFDVYIPAVTGLTAAEAATVEIATLRSTGAYYSVQMVVRALGVSWRVRYFKTPNVDLVGITSYDVDVVAATKYTVRFEYYRGEAGYPGGVYMSVNGVRATFPEDVLDSGQGLAQTLWLGIASCNTGLPFPAYFGNVTLDKRAVQDFTLRGTGDAFGYNALAVVNGIITAITTPAEVVFPGKLGVLGRFSVTRTGISWAGTNDQFVFSQGSISGVLTQGTVAAAHVFNINSDAVDALTANGNYNGYFGHTVNSASAKGHKTALAGVLSVSAATGNTANKFNTAVESRALASANNGGVSGTELGALFGGFDSASLMAGATFWSQVCGREIDIEARAGTAPKWKTGLQIVQRDTDVESGTAADEAFAIVNQANGTAPGWNIGITFGTPHGAWAIKSTGTMIGTLATSYAPAYAAAYGVDLSAVTFSQAAFKSSGFIVDGSGNVLVGIASPVANSSKLQTSNGIGFPATQVAATNANTLDDYEEGLFTPVLTFATPGDLAVTYTNQVGKYTKTGNQVAWVVRLTTSAFTHTTASGAANITGLPFAAAAFTSSMVAAASMRGYTKANFTQIGALISNSASIATLIASGSGQAHTNVLASDMPSGGTVDLYISGVYLT